MLKNGNEKSCICCSWQIITRKVGNKRNCLKLQGQSPVWPRCSAPAQLLADRQALSWMNRLQSGSWASCRDGARNVTYRSGKDVRKCHRMALPAARNCLIRYLHAGTEKMYFRQAEDGSKIAAFAKYEAAAPSAASSDAVQRGPITI